MKFFIYLVMSLSVVAMLSSCGDSKESLMEDQVEYMNDLAEIMEDVADGSLSSADAAEKIKDMKKTADGFVKRKKELFRDLSQEEMKALDKKYREKNAKAVQRYMKSIEKLKKSGRATRELTEAVYNM